MWLKRTKVCNGFLQSRLHHEKLKGLETELCQECRIVLNGEERWVSNVVMRGEIEDSEYAMSFLRDITESKAETARRMQMASDNASMDL